MKDDLIGRLRFGIGYHATSKHIADACGLMDTAADEIEHLRAEVAEARRRRDEWRKKAEGFDTIRRALREKIGDPPPIQMSRFLWAAIAADEKKRADDLETQLAARDAEIAAWLRESGEILRAFKGPSLAPSKFERTLARLADAIEAGDYRSPSQ